MPEWVLIVLGVLAGIAIVAAVLFFAAWPYLQARPPKTWLPDQKDNVDNMTAGGGWDGDTNASGFDGGGHAG